MVLVNVVVVLEALVAGVIVADVVVDPCCAAIATTMAKVFA